MSFWHEGIQHMESEEERFTRTLLETYFHMKADETLLINLILDYNRFDCCNESFDSDLFLTEYNLRTFMYEG